MQTTHIPTPAGTFTAGFSKRGLAYLRFPSDTDVRSTANQTQQSLSPDLRRWQKLTAAALRSALAGKAAAILPPLDLSGGTDFQQRVWSALRRIQPGKTQTYSQLAAAIGEPQAVRAVGNACGTNPIPVLVPCHRVLAKGGGLGGFSAGLNWKRRLLASEGVAVKAV